MSFFRILRRIPFYSIDQPSYVVFTGIAAGAYTGHKISMDDTNNIRNSNLPAEAIASTFITLLGAAAGGTAAWFSPIIVPVYAVNFGCLKYREYREYREYNKDSIN